MDEWFCQIAGREIGPMSSSQLKAMAAKGEILSTDTVRRGLAGKWIVASHVRGLLPPKEESPPPAAAVESPAAPESTEPPSFFGLLPPPSFFGSLPPPSFADVPPPSVAGVSPRREMGTGSEPTYPDAAESHGREVPVPIFSGAPEPNVAWPTETPPAPIVAPPPPAPPEDRVPQAAAPDVDAAPFDVFAESIEPVPVSRGVKSLAALAHARRKRQQQTLMVGVMIFVVCGLAVVCIVLGTGNLKGVAVVKDSGGLSGLSTKLKKAATQPVEDELEPLGVDDGLSASELKKSEAGSNTSEADAMRIGIGNCMVHVLSLIPAKDAKGTLESARLLVTIEVKNLSNIEPLDFPGWSRAPGQAGVKLSDDQGKAYLAKSIDAADVLGKPVPTTIEPGESIKDLVAFDLPDSKVQSLDLEVSGVAFGVNASATFKIPATKIAAKPIILRKSALTDAKSKAAKKKPRKVEPGTPEGDFGLFDDEDTPTK